MRPDTLKAREDVPPGWKWMAYDEADFAALVLRGANAHMGRFPGRLKEPDTNAGWYPEDLARDLDRKWDPADYSPRFYFEYPAPTLFFFRLPYLFNPDARGLVVPPCAADRFQYSVSQYVPRADPGHETERRVWACFRIATRFYVVTMAAGLVGLMLVLLRGYGPEFPRPGPVWLAALPAAVFFSLNRFDILPTLATALAFAALGRGKNGWAGVWLGVGAALKVYPVLFVPVVLRHLGVRKGVRFGLWFAAPLVVGYGVSFAVLGWEGTVNPIKVQMSRKLEIGNTLYDKVLPKELGEDGTARLAILAGVLAVVCATRPPTLASVLRRCGVVLVVFVNLAVFWSPQWILWFLPIVIPLAGKRWWPMVGAAVLDLANYLTFPVRNWLWAPPPDDPVADAWFEQLGNVLLFTRVGLWALLLLGFVWDEVRAWWRGWADG
jgi:hypothetical protein